MGLLNLWVAYSFSTGTWVNFKLFGGIGLMLLFTLAQGLYLSRYMKDDEAAGAKARPTPHERRPASAARPSKPPCARACSPRAARCRTTATCMRAMPARAKAGTSACASRARVSPAAAAWRDIASCMMPCAC